MQTYTQIGLRLHDAAPGTLAERASVAKAQGAKINVKKFIRFETGEGLEKKNENFAEEVAKQMGM